MSSLSRAEAAKLIADIRVDNGGISPEDRENTPNDVLRALTSTRRKLSSATKTLATNLYTKDTRFVYELIQNAEDNKYAQAYKDGVKPTLKFSVHPDHIVIDSNEDGFTDNDVRAICSTGESTKTNTEGYIGEKGIGFKSVFKIAKKVKIQSGPFAFAFEYSRGSDDDGLGMVTPLNEDYEELPEGVRTRMTLTLLRPENAKNHAQELLGIPDTLLLFLKKLRKLKIDVSEELADVSSVRYKRFAREKGKRQKIRKSVLSHREKVKEFTQFLVYSKKVEGLPPDEARRATDRASVVLAFPIDSERNPVIKQQHVYAYLPIRKAGFNFLIQSDFVTQASREEVFHSQRNIALLKKVAETFVDAALDMCHQEALRYQWTQYLPNGSIADEFWNSLAIGIISSIKDAPVLWTRSGKTLKCPSRLRVTPADFLDAQKEPLFQDTEDEIYLSPHYSVKARNTLRIEPLEEREKLVRVEHDLWKADGKMQAEDTDEDWHQRAAKLLLGLLHFDRIRKLGLIPLADSTWDSTSLRPVYYPEINSVGVPTDLGLRLVKKSATKDKTRRDLFDALGVETCDAQVVISKIKGKYKGTVVSAREGVSHAEFLFWFIDADVSVEEFGLQLLNSRGQFIRISGAKRQHIYFPDEADPYSTAELLPDEDEDDTDSPKFHFLNWEYLDALDEDDTNDGVSFREWLQEWAGVRSTIPFLSISGERLSQEMEYIIEHKPQALIHVLKRNQDEHYKGPCPSSTAKALSSRLLPAVNGETVELGKAYLPFPAVVEKLEYLGISTVTNFLLDTDPIEDPDPLHWQFLDRFKVGLRPDERFYSFCIDHLRNLSLGENLDLEEEKSLVLVYQHLADLGSTALSNIRETFRNETQIYLPPTADEDADWVTSEECVWSGPEWLCVKHCLSTIPAYASLEDFFRVTLKISDSSWKDYLAQLESFKHESSNNSNAIQAIYKRLWDEFKNDANAQLLRTEFEEKELIFDPSSSKWCPPTECIWADYKVKFPGMTCIAPQYLSLQDFFWRLLGVQKPDLSMHVESLRVLAKNQREPQPKHLKERIMLISSLDPKSEDLSPLKKLPIFPVKLASGKINCADMSAEFAIMDRPEYGKAFAGKVAILDFTLDEVRRSRAFFHVCGLSKFYMSNLVEENTEVDQGDEKRRLSDDFRSKAYALFRCAVHFSSPAVSDNDEDLFELLQNATIFASNGIIKSMTMRQYGEMYEVKSGKANFHLDEDSDGNLNLYVPKEREDRELCYLRQLPRGLLRYLQIDDSGAESVFVQIIQSKTLSLVDRILNDEGIVPVEGIKRPFTSGGGDDDNDDDDASVQDFRDLWSETNNDEPQFSSPEAVSVTSHFTSQRNNPRSHRVNGSRSVVHTPNITPPPRSLPSRLRSSISRRQHSSATTEATEEAGYELPRDLKGYVAILNHAIECAKEDVLPSPGDNRMYYSNSSVWTPHNLTALSTVFPNRSIERDRRIGAVGELFVYELLLAHGLPDFGEGNWRSTVRKYASEHEKYRELEPWEGIETADITYSDASGHLTEFFINEGYLDGDVWSGVKPKYFFEIKTTVGDYNERFYMSSSQYERMKRMHLTSGEASDEVYLICRVFKITSEEIGMRLYFDPEEARQNGELSFGVDTWTAKPL